MFSVHQGRRDKTETPELQSFRAPPMMEWMLPKLGTSQQGLGK